MFSAVVLLPHEEECPAIQAFLKELPLTLYFTASVDECKAVAQQRNPDLLILDVTTPGEDARQVCNAFDLPMVFLSRLSIPEERRDQFKRCNSIYLTKPYKVQTFLSSVLGLLQANWGVPSTVSETV